MKIIRPIAFAVVFLSFGAIAGYQLALLREHNRLERNKALVRRAHTDVWSEADLRKVATAARSLYASNFVVHDWTGDDMSGVDGLIEGLADNRADFPDWAEHTEAIIAEGDLVVDRFLSTGTQARDLKPVVHHSPGIPNRRKFLRMPEMEMFRVVDGKLAEQWDFADIWSASAQLGLYNPDRWMESICTVEPAARK